MPQCAKLALQVWEPLRPGLTFPWPGDTPGDLRVCKPVLVVLVGSGAVIHPADRYLEMLKTCHYLSNLQQVAGLRR